MCVVQIIVDYVAVVMCMTDSLDEPPTRRVVTSKSPSALRSAHRLSHHDRRCKSLSTDSGRRDCSSAPTWQHRRPGADSYRNGRPTARYAVVERPTDPAAEPRKPGTTAPVRPDEDDAGEISAAGLSPTLISDVHEVRRLMAALQSRMNAKDAVEQVARDWRLVATCLDRILFCLYCAVVAVSLAVYFPRSEA